MAVSEAKMKESNNYEVALHYSITSIHNCENKICILDLSVSAYISKLSSSTISTMDPAK